LFPASSVTREHAYLEPSIRLQQPDATYRHTPQNSTQVDPRMRCVSKRGSSPPALLSPSITSDESLLYHHQGFKGLPVCTATFISLTRSLNTSLSPCRLSLDDGVAISVAPSPARHELTATSAGQPRRASSLSPELSWPSNRPSLTSLAGVDVSLLAPPSSLLHQLPTPVAPATMAITTRNGSGQHKKPAAQEQQHGAQVLLQKPVTTKTATVNSQHVNIEQSLQLVQTIMHGCLAHILYQKSLYPQYCYQSRYFDPDGPEWSYKDYIGGEDRAIDTPNGSPIFSLKKGVSERTGRLLDLLVACSYSYICYD
jgi:hypothetical protein